MTSVDVPSAEFVINQSALIIALIVSAGSAAGIAFQAYRGVKRRVRKANEEAEARSNAKHENTKRFVEDKLRDIKEEFINETKIMREKQQANASRIDNLKDQLDFLYRKIVDGFFGKQ